MAYPKFSKEGSATAATSFVPELPTHVSGDYIVVFVAQDNGATAITASGSWTGVGTQAQSGATRGAVFYLKAASGSETVTISSSTNAPWVYVATVIKDADATTFVDGWTRSDWNLLSSITTADVDASSNGGSAITTSQDDCLLLFMWCSDGGPFMRTNQAGMIELGKQTANGVSVIAGYRQQGAASTIPAVTMYSTTAAEGGNGFVVAVRNATSGSRAPDCLTGETRFRWYGEWGVTHDATTTWITPNDSGTPANGITGGATIDGIAVNTAVGSVVTNSLSYAWGFTSSINLTQNTAGSWCGAMHTCSATDFTGKIFSIEHSAGVISAARFGDGGNIIVFKDGTGNWAAYTLARRVGYEAANVNYTAHIDISTATVLQSSGTMDWTTVSAVAYLQHRIGSSTGQNAISIRNAYLWLSSSIIGGGANRPATFQILPRAFNQWGATGLVNLQGSKQNLVKTKIQIGDGTNATYFDMSASSLEFPPTYAVTPSDSLIEQTLWNVGALGAVTLNIKPSASDTINLTAGALVTTTKQTLTIDAAASTSAALSTAGLSVVGWNPTWKTGVPCSGATFKTCGIIAFAGADIVNATISDGTGTAALSASNGFSATGSALTASATCLYGIRIAAAGTFDLASTTFSGFTKDIDVTAAVGTVTVNLAVGQATPTHQTAGATVTFVSSPVFQSVTVAGLAVTARIQIYDATSSTQLYLGVPGTASHTWTDSAAASGSRSIRLRIMRCVGTSADIIVDKLIGTCGTTEAAKAVSYLHDAVLDTAYNGNAFDGSTITGFTIDDSNMRLEIASGTIVAYGGVDTLVIDGRKAYAYETYWLSTDAGLVDESRFIIATDGVNLRFVDFKLKNTTSGPAYPVIIHNAYVVDDATGVSASLTDYTGGPIHYAPDHMISNVVTVGGVNIITGDEATILSAIAAQKVPLTLPQFVALK